MKKIRKILEDNRIIMELILGFLQVISVVLVFYTLKEMESERIATYKPSIYFGSAEYDFGDVQLDTESNPMFSVEHKTLDVINVGVGSAKSITLSIDKDTIVEAVNKFNDLSECGDITYEVIDDYAEGGDIVHFANGAPGLDMRDTESYNIPYLLPESGNVYKLDLPEIYYDFIYAFCLEYDLQWKRGYIDIYNVVTIPDIEMILEYQDIQGLTYIERVALYITITDPTSPVFEVSIKYLD